MKERGVVVARGPCPECSTSGNGKSLVTYDDAGSYCFECGYYTTDGECEERRPMPRDLIKGTYAALPTRGISEETCRKLDYQVGRYTGPIGGNDVVDEYVHIANYRVDGEVVWQKIRNKNKDFTMLGEFGDTLFGADLCEPTDKKELIIVEGEIDCLTVSQVMGKRASVVSIPSGTNAAHKVLKANLEWLNKWGQICIAFDNDKAGRKAQEQCVGLFDPSQVKLVTWTDVDPNQMLVSGNGKQISEDILHAKAYAPASIISADDIMDDILKDPEYGLDWPWPALTKATYGIHPKTIYTIGGGSGCGKTEVLISVLHTMVYTHKQRVGCLFLETPPKEIFRRIAGLAMGQRLHVPGVICDKEMLRNTLAGIQDWVKLYDVSRAGAAGGTWEEVKAKIIYMVRGLGIKYILIDHLTALACHFKDERRGLDALMAELGVLVGQLDCTVFLVSHLSAPPPGTKTFEAGRQISPRDFRGSQSIQYWSMFMFGIERNKFAEEQEDRRRIILRILKDRFTGESDGLTVHMKYNMDTGVLDETAPDETDIDIESSHI